MVNIWMKGIYINGVISIVDIEVVDDEFVDLISVVRGSNDVEIVIFGIFNRVFCWG